MPVRKGLTAPQNNFLDTIATRFDGTHSNFVLGNAQVPPSFPIVYCSDGFVELTGYSRAHIMQKGCACKFLYGAGTKSEDKEVIDNALKEKNEIKLEICLYKKNGTSFWCLLDIVPIKNEKRQVVLFLASHKEIPPPRSATVSSNTLAVPGFDDDNPSKDDLDDEDETPIGNHLLQPNLDPEAPANYNYGRRRSRAVLYQLSGHYKTDKSKKMHNKLNTSLLSPPSTNIQPLPEYKTSVVKKPRWVLSHYGVIKTCWDVLVLCATIYVAITVPYNAAFKSKHYGFQIGNDRFRAEDSAFLLLKDDNNVTVPGGNQSDTFAVDGSILHSLARNYDVVIEAIFILDIILNFRTTFVNKKGEVVSSSKCIAFNYLKGWFVLDLVAALPFDLLELITDRDSESFTSIHLLKLTRMLRLARLLQKMERYSQYSAVILTLLMMTFALLAHWLACLWFVIGEIEQLDNPSTDASDVVWPGWINLLAQRLGLPNGSYVPHSEAYVTALYYSCTSLTTVGFGNVSANTTWEKIFSVVIMLIGALMHATIFGNVTALVQRLYGARKALYQTKWRNLKDFAILHSVPKHLKQRMQDYFQTMWSLNHGIDPVEILQDYPEELRGDVSLHLHKEILSLPIFETAGEGCKKLLSIQIKTNFCAPEEFLIHKGDALHNIYYLYNGSMEVLQDNMVVAILGKGDLFGCDIMKHLEPPLLLGGPQEIVVKSSCDVRALTYCDLKCLYIPGLIEVLRLYPEFQEQFKEDIKHDLTFNLREGYEAEDSSVENGESILPLHSITEELDDIKSTTSNKSVLSALNGEWKHKEVVRDISHLSSEMKSTMEKLEKLTLAVKTMSTSTQSVNNQYQDKSVQTDFPAIMLEEYVIKNRKRILQLLGMSSEVSSSSSWNPLPATSPISTHRSFPPVNRRSSPSRAPGMTRFNSTPLASRSRTKLLYQQKTLPSISLCLATPEDEKNIAFTDKCPRKEGFCAESYKTKKRNSTGSANSPLFEEWNIKRHQIKRDEGSTASLDSSKPRVTDF